MQNISSRIWYYIQAEPTKTKVSNLCKKRAFSSLLSFVWWAVVWVYNELMKMIKSWYRPGALWYILSKAHRFHSPAPQISRTCWSSSAHLSSSSCWTRMPMISSSASKRLPLDFGRHALTTLSSHQRAFVLSSPKSSSSCRLASRLAGMRSSSSLTFFRSCLASHDLFTSETSGSHYLTFFHPHFTRLSAAFFESYDFGHWVFLVRHSVFRCFCFCLLGLLLLYQYYHLFSLLWWRSSLFIEIISSFSASRAIITSFTWVHCWRR